MTTNPFTPARIAALTERIHVTTREQIIDLTVSRSIKNQAAIQAAFGHEAPIERFVDGQPNKPLSQVNPAGFTLTRFELLTNVVDEAIKALVLASPVGPAKGGHYRDDHWLFVNGQRRDFGIEGSTVILAANDNVIIVNLRPYSRKIEGGARERFRGRMTNRRPGLSVQAPNGVYEITARDLQRRFGNVASIRFAYRGLVGAPSPAGRARQDRYPALEISARGEGSARLAA